MVQARGQRVYSDGSLPLGTLANAELRALRLRAHALVDPHWRSNGAPGTRSMVYAWMAAQLAIPVHECHIGLFDEARCHEVIKLLAEQSPQVAAVPLSGKPL